MASYRARTDENALFERNGSVRLIGAKKIGVTTNTGTIRRAALGDLANRSQKVGAPVDPKKSTNHVENESGSVPCVIDLKKIKPRVDTHWAHQPLRKPLTRSDSLRTSNLPINGASAAAGPKLVKTRTMSIQSVKEVKYITTGKSIATKQQKSKSPERPTIKREESNLSQKSITKIRAASVLIKTERAPISKTSLKASDTKILSNVSNQLQNRQIAIKQEKVETPVETVIPSHSSNMLVQFNDIDIDAGDDANPLLVSEYVNDIYSYLYHLETEYAIRKNHLDGQRDVFPKMRGVLIDWINEVHLQYRFVQETFHMAVSIIDRYLQAIKTTSRQNLQLVGVAALFIASKYEELYPPEICDFVYITDDTYTVSQVIEMEKHILKTLTFELGPPLSIHFLRRYSKAAQSDAKTHIMSKYFIELATVDYRLCEYRPSQIAAASLFISLCIIESQNGMKNKQIDYNAIWNQTLEYYSTYSLKELLTVVKPLAEYIVNAPAAKLNNIYKKYSSAKLNEIALITASSAHIVHDIIAFNL